MTAQPPPPFKPFTPGEVASFGVGAKALDAWMGSVLPLRIGEGAVGLEWMQAYAAFVGQRFLDEGSTQERAAGVVHMLANLSVEYLESECKAGNVHPVPQCVLRDGKHPHWRRVTGLMVPAPKGRLGEKLNCATLYEEFVWKVRGSFT